MNCPSCDKHIRWDWLEHECIEANDEFECPECNTLLRYTIDEGTYYGAQHKELEIVDD